jgi:hypothetical protein
MSSCWISYEHLQKMAIKKLNWASLSFNKMLEMKEGLMAKMVEQWTSIRKVVGSTPTQVNFWWLLSTLFEFFFVHSHIHKI